MDNIQSMPPFPKRRGRLRKYTLLVFAKRYITSVLSTYTLLLLRKSPKFYIPIGYILRLLSIKPIFLLNKIQTNIGI